MRTIQLFIAGIAVLLLGGCIELEQDYVAVVGVGEAHQFPDHATIIVGVVRTEKTSPEAVEALNEIVAEIYKVATDFGIAEENILSGNLNVSRTYDRIRRPDGSSQSIHTGYDAEQTLIVRIDDVWRAGELLGELNQAGAETFSNPEFRSDDEAALFEKARDLAIQDALRRAREYAKASNKTLGDVQIIEESGLESQRLKFSLRDVVTDKYRQEDSIQYESRQDMIMVTGSRSAIFVRPEEMSATVSIYAKFALED